MSTKMQRVRFAAFFSISLRISHGKYIAWRKANKTEVSRFGNKFEKAILPRYVSNCQVKLSVKDKIKLSMEYFDSEA